MKSAADTVTSANKRAATRKAGTASPNASENHSHAGDALITVERTMRIIEMLADSRDGLSVTEISRRLD
ncbi:helix-turn-helix domain-containing protein, partial [Paraburkholderia elongata]